MIPNFLWGGAKMLQTLLGNGTRLLYFCFLIVLFLNR